MLWAATGIPAEPTIVTTAAIRPGTNNRCHRERDQNNRRADGSNSGMRGSFCYDRLRRGHIDIADMNRDTVGPESDFSPARVFLVIQDQHGLAVEQDRDLIAAGLQTHLMRTIGH